MGNLIRLYLEDIVDVDDLATAMEVWRNALVVTLRERKVGLQSNRRGDPRFKPFWAALQTGELLELANELGIATEALSEPVTDAERIAGLYEGGETFASLAKRFCITKADVREILIAEGVTIRERNETPESIARRHAIIEDRISGLSMGELGAKYGVTRQAICIFLKKQGVK